ncbi:MAG: aminotransferase class I/II-fold pyridoxal phosphate-dependent enzyme, partial [Bacillota bacterium]|nr:aminotransferase class I/II-fold pyridoxal phosphate-dependent enzyme [Bacillota bacterium]
MFNPAKRVDQLGSGIFSRVDFMKQKAIKQGIEVINLSIGSPDGSPALHIIEAIHRGLDNHSNYDYTLTHGTPKFREAVSKWYRDRFQVELNPDNEVLPLMGSQEGLSHIFLAYLNSGDIAIIPDPGYPVYSAGLALAEGELYPLPLLEENNYLPKFEEVPQHICEKAKIMVLNYPNNPLAAVAELDFFKAAIE